MKSEYLGLYWRTLRHLKPEQLRYLVWRRLFHQPRSVPLPSAVKFRNDAAHECGLPAPVTCWLGGNRFRFLNHERDFGTRVDWDAEGESRLWQYNLHYFDWLRQPECNASTVVAHIQDWIAANPPFEGTGWEPYPTSLRLVNWLLASGRVPASDVPRAVEESIALQTAWLERSIEYHLGANHVFANVKALLFGAAAFDDHLGSRLRARASRLLARELDEQFLDDGGHYERSPMYHAILTGDLLELCALARRHPDLLPTGTLQRLQATALRALDFARALRPPDDSVFLFNDAAAHIAPTCAALDPFAARVLSADVPSTSTDFLVHALDDSGYYVVRKGGHMLVIDCGDIGPPHQPGHAHCDTLSFELYLGGRRIVTNCGNHDYDQSAERAYARSTRAHNTLQVDGVEQSEIWGAFRVGRRARPLHASLVRSATGAEFRGAHDGYHHLNGSVTHTREVRIGNDIALIVADEVSGAGEHEAVSWLHFAPGLDVHPDGDQYRVCDPSGTSLAVIGAIVADRAEVLSTPRYPEFGVALTGSSLRFSASGRLPLKLGFALEPAEMTGATWN